MCFRTPAKKLGHSKTPLLRRRGTSVARGGCSLVFESKTRCEENNHPMPSAFPLLRRRGALFI